MNNQGSIVELFIESILIFGIIAGIILGVQFGYIYLVVSILSLLTLLYINKIRKERSIRLRMDELARQWGKEHEEKRNFVHIKDLYNLLNRENKDNFTIDDITWRDLNMDSVFSRIDHTKSLPGMQCLYNILRNPIFNQDILKERNNTVNQLKDNKRISQKIQYYLSLIGKKEANELFSYFDSGLNVEKKPLLVYRILSYVSYLSIIGLFIDKQLGFIILISVIMINASIYQSNKNSIYAELEIFRYISGIIKTAENIVKLDTEGIDLGQSKIKTLLKSTKQISKNISVINTNSSGNTEIQIIMDYINLITLRETIIFYKTVNLINNNRDKILEIYNYIGKIDAYVSIASYKDSLDYYTEPKFIKDNNTFNLEVEKLYHPLLDKPIPYTFQLNNIGALVTGSNASGKSTYLRTIGINTLFSQTLYLVLGEKYHANYFKLLTSIGTTDSIVEGDSYFMSEAKSLKRIIDSLEEEYPVLCILDEIFRGTNTAERISAAKEVLEYMIARKCCVIAATHDLELTTMVSDRFHNYHFQETIEENDIKFDYVLRHGPATSRNAIAILRYLSYPEEIYKNADMNVEKYEIFNFNKLGL